jgi:LETM1 and EF-hand domain-containing protein 1
VTQQIDKKVSLTSKLTPSVNKISDGVKNGKQQMKLWFSSRIDMKPHENRLRPIRAIIYYSLAFRLVCSTVKYAIIHTWKSGKLFWLNAKIGYKIAKRIMRGENVSAIDRNRLRRALADIFLMLPFSIFIIIPGAEVLIPFYIKKFRIPTTFESLSQKQQRQIKGAQARITLATFLHETLEEMTNKQKVKNSAKMIDFMKFTKEVRSGGRWVTNEDFKKYAPLFQDELTIDRMDRQTVDALCRIFKASPVKRAIAAGLGNQHAQLQSTQLMRLLLQRRIHNLKFEDKEWVEHIKRHGIGSIPEEDLQELSRDRGMRALGLTRERLERQYLDWVELATDPQISDSMLAYTRMLYMPKAIDKMGKAMETAIEKKVQKPAPVEKKEINETRDKEYQTTTQLISKSDLLVLKEAVRAAKMKRKPLASAQDYLGDRVKELQEEIEEDKEEGNLNNSVLKKIDKMTSEAEKAVNKIDVEKDDVEISIKDLLENELRERNVNKNKIEQKFHFIDRALQIKEVMEMVDTNKDGMISLQELENCIELVSSKLNDKSAISFEEFLEMLKNIKNEEIVLESDKRNSEDEMIKMTPPMVDPYDTTTTTTEVKIGVLEKTTKIPESLENLSNSESEISEISPPDISKQKRFEKKL